MYTSFRATSKPQRVVSRQSACHVNENLKMANLIYRQMPAPRELPQQIFPLAKAWMQSPGARLTQIPWARGRDLGSL